MPRRKADAVSDEAAQIADWAAQVLLAADELGIANDPVEPFCLSPAQRRVVLLLPGVSKALKRKLTRPKPSFSLKEIAALTIVLAADLPHGDAWRKVAVLLVVRHLMDQLQAVFDALEPQEQHYEPTDARTTGGAIYQIKVTLQGIQPQIWRRIQIEDCSLDRLHEHIQTAMGWPNAHLHQFRIGDVRYGDPELLCKGQNDESLPISSLITKLSAVVSQHGTPFALAYDYDFTDDWRHEVLVEDCLEAKARTLYPLCLDGERACPPDSVGGIDGYQEYLEAMAVFSHEQQEELKEYRGRFDPERFDPSLATARMQHGLPERQARK
jgi:hypothetical protein